MSVGRSLLQRLVHGDHHLLRSAGAQAVGVVQGYVAHVHRPRPLAQLAHLVHVVGDAVDLGLVAIVKSTGAVHPFCRETK